MPKTAKKHFDEDIARARAILDHAEPLPSIHRAKSLLRDDLFRSSLMYAVGAMDAYFCDAYADLVARILRAKNLQPDLHLTEAIEKIAFPVGVIFASTNMKENWKWRNAARSLIERDNMISISKIRDAFNPFLRTGHKLFDSHVVDHFVTELRAPQRLVGITATNYRRLNGVGRDAAGKSVRKSILKRYTDICQRRHDCIHNCDRPKATLLAVTYFSTHKVVEDIELLINFSNPHFESEFNHYLRNAGASALTRNATGYSA